MREVSVLALALFLTGCQENVSQDVSTAGEDSISTAEMPTGQPLVLDSSHNVRVAEHGLQFDEGYYYVRDSSKPRWVPSSHGYGHDDTAYFTPVVKGYGVVDGKVAVSCSITIRDSDGKVIHDSRGGKHVSRFPEGSAPYASFEMPVAWLDSLAERSDAPYYDVEYALKDRVNGRSMDGIFRIHVRRAE
jgi:hypothetical protein